jgi:8-oxo-dGTP diphosphatase
VLERPATRKPPYSVDIIALTPKGEELAVLMKRVSESPERWVLPWSTPSSSREDLDDVATRLLASLIGRSSSWLEQLGAFAGGMAHPAEVEISVAFVSAIPMNAEIAADQNLTWIPLGDLRPLPARQQAMVGAAIERVQARLDQTPVAFRLLPNAFTLSELQHTYELLLGKRLHKASFRRALHSAWLVEPTDEWHSEGRGRPAQLYRYSPRKRRRGRRGVRFDFLVL